MQIPSFAESEILGHTEPDPVAVLVVDDEPTIRDTLRAYLLRLGIPRVDTASNGKLAMEAMRNEDYEYVFMDLMMPEMDGMQVLQDIPQGSSPTSVIVMTGYPSMEKVIEAMRHGASDFLIKPFRLQDVKFSMERIRRLHALMKRNWSLKQELAQKAQVENLNNQLRKEIRERTILYDIIESLSRINRSEELYQYLVQKAVTSCNAQKSCFLIYQPGDPFLLAYSQHGLGHIRAGEKVALNRVDDRLTIDQGFIQANFVNNHNHAVHLDQIGCYGDLIAVPFHIRRQPFGILLVSGKIGAGSFEKEDEFVLTFLVEKAALNAENMALYDSLKESLFATLGSLVSAIEARDSYTQQHSERVTNLSVRIALEMKCPVEDLRRLESTGPLHDIGKIGIEDDILKKPGPLTEEEFAKIKTHPLIGVSIVAPLDLDEQELSIIRNHHERWDGAGYPDGLKGKQVPRLARILAVADAFDAMNSDRAYRMAIPFQTCLRELKAKSGSQFDPSAVKAALSVLKR